MEEKKLNELQLEDINLSCDPTVEDAIEAIKMAKSYIIVHTQENNMVGLIKNVHDEEPLDFVMNLLGGIATLGFIAKYLRSTNTVLGDKLADECTILADKLFVLYINIEKEDDDESDE